MKNILLLVLSFLIFTQLIKADERPPANVYGSADQLMSEFHYWSEYPAMAVSMELYQGWNEFKVWQEAVETWFTAEQRDDEAYQAVVDWRRRASYLFRRDIESISAKERNEIAAQVDAMLTEWKEIGDFSKMPKKGDLVAVKIGGRVRKPGIFAKSAPLTLGELIRQSGGLEFDAYAQFINLYRGGKGRSFNLRFEKNQQFEIMTGDIVIVPRRSAYVLNFEFSEKLWEKQLANESNLGGDPFADNTIDQLPVSVDPLLKDQTYYSPYGEANKYRELLEQDRGRSMPAIPEHFELRSNSDDLEDYYVAKLGYKDERGGTIRHQFNPDGLLPTDSTAMSARLWIQQNPFLEDRSFARALTAQLLKLRKDFPQFSGQEVEIGRCLFPLEYLKHYQPGEGLDLLIEVEQSGDLHDLKVEFIMADEQRASLKRLGFPGMRTTAFQGLHRIIVPHGLKGKHNLRLTSSAPANLKLAITRNWGRESAETKIKNLHVADSLAIDISFD